MRGVHEASFWWYYIISFISIWLLQEPMTTLITNHKITIYSMILYLDQLTLLIIIYSRPSAIPHSHNFRPQLWFPHVSTKLDLALTSILVTPEYEALSLITNYYLQITVLTLLYTANMTAVTASYITMTQSAITFKFNQPADWVYSTIWKLVSISQLNGFVLKLKS